MKRKTAITIIIAVVCVVAALACVHAVVNYGPDIIPALRRMHGKL